MSISLDGYVLETGAPEINTAIAISAVILKDVIMRKLGATLSGETMTKVMAAETASFTGLFVFTLALSRETIVDPRLTSSALDLLIKYGAFSIVSLYGKFAEESSKEMWDAL